MLFESNPSVWALLGESVDHYHAFSFTFTSSSICFTLSSLSSTCGGCAVYCSRRIQVRDTIGGQSRTLKTSYGVNENQVIDVFFVFGLFANMFVRELLSAIHICSQLNKHVHNTNQRKQLLCKSRFVTVLKVLKNCKVYKLF